MSDRSTTDAIRQFWAEALAAQRAAEQAAELKRICEEEQAELRRLYKDDPIALRALDAEIAKAADDIAEGRKQAVRQQVPRNAKHGVTVPERRQFHGSILRVGNPKGRRRNTYGRN